MDNCITMDGDSGYISHNHESNMDSSLEHLDRSKLETNNLYMNEDALLEKPCEIDERSKDIHWKKNDSFDSVVNTSQESVATEFSGFEDSGQSIIIPPVPPIVWNINDYKENLSSMKTTPDPALKFFAQPHKVLANVTNTYETINAALNKNNLEDNCNSSYVVTPKKRYENRMNGQISPDLFGDEEFNSTSFVERSPIKKESPMENHYTKDVNLLKHVQTSLSGLHPPPKITISQMSVHEMLEKINENGHLFSTIGSEQSSDEEISKSLLIDNKPDCVTLEWPEILKCRFHGLYYNRSKVTEEFEHLCLKYAERYVGAETQSSCRIFDSNSSSSQKRKFSKPKWGSKSPGRRLSHLARRRITFSSANLQANSSSILGSRARQILVDARKLSMLKKSPRKSPRKTPSKSPFKIRRNTPSSSAKKKLALRFREMSGEFETSIPNCSTNRSNRMVVNKDREMNSPCGGSMEKKSTKRALFLSPLKHSPNKKSPFKLHSMDRKRKRTDSENASSTLFSRSISFDHDMKQSEVTCTLSRTFSESSSRSEELSDQHKKKLQWAVYESLRLQNITPTHPNYKVYASVLARVTRKFLPNMRFEGRTTEKMFRIARCHSYAVVKGKSVDEIMNEYMKNKIKTQKPQGYVGLDSIIGGNKENAGHIDNMKKNVTKVSENNGLSSISFSQNRIDRIKKVISFEDKN